MASRNFTQFSYSLEKAVVSIFAVVDFNDASAPSLKQWNTLAQGGAGNYSTASATFGYKGVKSIARSAQGKYLITLTDNYTRLIDINASFKAIDGVTSPKAQDMFVMAEAVVSQTTPTITLGFTNTPNSATLVDLGANDRVFFTIILSNSSAQ